MLYLWLFKDLLYLFILLLIIRKTTRSTKKIQVPFLFCNIFYDNLEILHEFPFNDYHEIIVSGHVKTLSENIESDMLLIHFYNSPVL